MNLINIINLFESDALPTDKKTLRSCEKILKSAYKVTLEAWTTTSKPATEKMLWNELELYLRITREVKRRIQISAGRVPTYSSQPLSNQMFPF